VATSSQSATNELGRAIWELPNSSDSVADQYEKDARTAMMRNDTEAAVAALRSAVGKDPKFARGWLLLGSLLSARFQQDAAVDAYRSATSAAPDQVICYKLLGLTLLGLSRFEEAVPVWQTVMKLAEAEVSALEDEVSEISKSWSSLTTFRNALYFS
jgi:cytochrome c-type biogenesis protein CcmH/NrfG